jgi:hypothetical protein
MTISFSALPRTILLTGVALTALVMLPAVMDMTTGGNAGFISKAYADDDGDGDGGQGKMGGKKQQGSSGGQGKGQGAIGGSGMGQGGPSSDSEGKGPRAGQSGQGDKGGKPVWAQEGIPAVELGRLSVVRAPAHVIARALEEAVLTWDDAMATLYELSAEDAAALLASDYENVVRFDSPLANLGLYQDLLTDGYISIPVAPASTLDLAAILLGSASDKTLEITTDTVIAVNAILGLPELTDSAIETLAEQAEAIRQAILAGHG